jgi:hypothetical protein
MKIEQQKQEFRPVVITLDTQEECHRVMALIRTAIDYYEETAPTYVLAKAITEALLNATTNP